MSKKRKKRLQARDNEQVEPSLATTEAPGEIPVPYPKTESASESVESEKAGVSEQEPEPEKMGSGEEDLSNGDSEEAGTRNSQIGRSLPLWVWGLVVVAGFLIAFWLVNTYVLGTPSPSTWT
ncbi:MAG: hypothetical protein WCC63_04675 [Candidatus Bathyarchaeia archaeon]